MTARDIVHEGLVLARHLAADAWPEALAFHSADADFLQVGTWSYKAGRQLAAHRHNPVPREVGHTQELVFVRRGRLAATIYALDDTPVERIELRAGDVLVLLHGGHGYEILEDDTQVLEVKNGPYVGAETDRTRLGEERKEEVP